MAIMLLLSISACNAQIKNAKTESVKIYGNCGMCETTIEKAGNIKNIAKVDWNKDTKMADLTFDTSKTSKDEILKRIALAGYDSEQFLAPNDVYSKLPECCQYERLIKSVTEKVETVDSHSNHHDGGVTDQPTETNQEEDQLYSIFKNYFALKDALVKSDGSLASTKAKELLQNLNALESSRLSKEEQTTWMNVMRDLILDAEHIKDIQDIERQRGYFNTLSDNMYPLIKVANLQTPVYYQHCPMANNGKGANWLSKENTVKNPYYGSKMLSCGKTVETIE